MSVNVYRNLAKPNHFSITRSGKVENHGTCIKLVDCQFHVNENGRIKVTQRRRKGVHAWVKGMFYDIGEHSVEGFDELYYDPYFTLGFMSLSNGRIVKQAQTVVCKNNRCYAKGVLYESPSNSLI